MRALALVALLFVGGVFAQGWPNYHGNSGGSNLWSGPGKYTRSTISYATWNPSDKGSSVTLSGGNLTATISGVNGVVRATLGKSTGKWYWEIKQTAHTTNNMLTGVANTSAALTFCGADANGWGFYGDTGNKFTAGSGSAYGTAYGDNDVIGVALDMTAGKVWFSKNGAWQASGDPVAGTNAAFTGLSGTLYPCGCGAGANQQTCIANFGASTFVTAPPSGYSAGVF